MAFSGAGQSNRCPHFAGNRLQATLKKLGESYTTEFWFWNGLPNDIRPVTGYLFARGGEALALGGTKSTPGALVFDSLAGRTVIAPKTWNHVALVRDGSRVAVYLNGNPAPEITGEAAPERSHALFLAGRCDKAATFGGKIDEVAIYDRPLSPDEIRRHYQLAGLSGAGL